MMSGSQSNGQLWHFSRRFGNCGLSHKSFHFQTVLECVVTKPSGMMRTALVDQKLRVRAGSSTGDDL